MFFPLALCRRLIWWIQFSKSKKIVMTIMICCCKISLALFSKTASWAKCHPFTKINIRYSHGGQVGAQNNSEKKSFGNLILLLCKTWATFCHCFVHQHGRLITWVKTKNQTSQNINRNSSLRYEGWELLYWSRHWCFLNRFPVPTASILDRN